MLWTQWLGMNWIASGIIMPLAIENLIGSKSQPSEYDHAALVLVLSENGRIPEGRSQNARDIEYL
jgi:hypothetical protein